MVTKTGSEEARQGQMPLSGHLRELRNRILVCITVLLAALLAGLRFSPGIVETLLSIGRKYGYAYVYIAPQELLMQYVSVALLAGLVITLPVLCYEVWAFARPGLSRGENGLFLLAMVFGLLFFCSGVFFALQIMLPFMLRFLIELSVGSSASPSVTVENYIGFLMTIFMIFGTVFELPVVSVLLTWLGLLKTQWMRKGRRVVVVAVFFIAALITPPDVVSQVMVAIPMLALYELSILLCALFQRLHIHGKTR